MRVDVAVADRADPVVAVDVAVAAEVGAGQKRDGEIRETRSESFCRIRRRQIDLRKNRQHRRAARLRPQPQLRADLNVAETARTARGVALRDETVRADGFVPQSDATGDRKRTR